MTSKCCQSNLVPSGDYLATGIVVPEETVVATEPEYEMVVTGSQPNPWDVNPSGTLDLSDIIYGLQVLSDIRPE